MPTYFQDGRQNRPTYCPHMLTTLTTSTATATATATETATATATATTTTTTTTTTTPPPPTTPARAAGSTFAGARLSGVSLINPGAGPAPVSSPEAFGGNRRLNTAAAPAADHLRSIPPHPRFTIIVVIYSVFCVWCSKNIVFYRVLWPSPSPGFISATLKNHGFFMVLGLRKGSGTENWTS